MQVEDNEVLAVPTDTVDLNYENARTYNFINATSDKALELMMERFGHKLDEDDKTLLNDMIGALAFRQHQVAEPLYIFQQTVVDRLRNENAYTPDLRYLTLSFSLEANQAIMGIDVVALAREVIEEQGLDGEWTDDLPDHTTYPVEGRDILYINSMRQVRPGKLTFFRYVSGDKELSVTDIFTVFDAGLNGFIALPMVGLWKYLPIVEVTHDTVDEIIPTAIDTVQ